MDGDANCSSLDRKVMTTPTPFPSGTPWSEGEDRLLSRKGRRAACPGEYQHFEASPHTPSSEYASVWVWAQECGNGRGADQPLGPPSFGVTSYSAPDACDDAVSGSAFCGLRLGMRFAVVPGRSFISAYARRGRDARTLAKFSIYCS